MLACFFYLVRFDADVAELDALARARNVNGIMAYAGPGVEERDFAFLKQNGAFGTGSLGWTVHSLEDPTGGKKYIVFGTPLTTQDFGEFVFEFDGEKMTRLEDEREHRGYRVLDYDFKLSFQPAEKRANMEVLVKLRREAGAAAAAHLRLSPHYKVSLVTDAGGSPLQFNQAGGVVSITPPTGQEPVIKMTYSGIVNKPQFAGAITDDEVMLTNDYWWPMIARGPATVSTTATIPSNWMLVTHGNKVSDVVHGSHRVVSYRMDVPVSYLSLSAGPFRHVEKKVGRITYHVWTRRMSDEAMRQQLDLMPPVVEFYERFAPYPFDGFGAMVTELYGGGALEAYSFATYGTGWLPDEDTHEPAHTWWGGLVANTYMNSSWNESFAVYAGGLYLREVGIGNTAERRKAFVAQNSVERDYARAPIEGTGSFAGGIASSLGYGKGGFVLQQLEYEIGTPKMIEAMRTWITDNPKGVAAEWSGFEKAVEKATGKDMAWFFDPWLRRPGAPDFTVSNVGFEGNRVYGKVAFNGTPYQIKTEVFVEYPDGTFDHVDVDLKGKSDFSFPVAKKPRMVSFDPYDRILRNHGPAPTNRLQNRIGRMQAVLDTKHREYAATFADFNNRPETTVPTDPSGSFFIGHPDTMPIMRDLCRRAGFTVEGDKLTYDGTTIDLNQGAAMALIDLGGGKSCAIGLGVTELTPNFGIARLALVDKYGRFLRGKTDPRREGPLVFNLP